MKAIIYTKYGYPGFLHLDEIVKPVPNANEVLVKMMASSQFNLPVERQALRRKGDMRSVLLYFSVTI